MMQRALKKGFVQTVIIRITQLLENSIRFQGSERMQKKVNQDWLGSRLSDLLQGLRANGGFGRFLIYCSTRMCLGLTDLHPWNLENN
jgi:hypothetical protein